MSSSSSCLALWSVPSAVNQSWLCNSGGCYFLYFQQLNRPSPYCSYGESLAALIVCGASVPANVSCLIDFHRRNVKRELLLLIATYAICNIALTILGTLTTFARTSDDFLYGETGCALLPYLSLTLITMSVWSMTLLSFERRARICGPTASQAAPWHDERRIYRTACILLFILGANLLFWSYPFFAANVAHLIPVNTSIINQGRRTMMATALEADEEPEEENSAVMSNSTVKTNYVCTFSMRVASRRLFAETMFVAFGFIVPILLNVLNYCKIWIYVHKKSKAASFGRRHLVREINLAIVLAISLVLFVLFTVPFQIVVFFIAYDQRRDQTMQSTAFFLSAFMLYVRAALSPIVFNFLRPDSFTRSLRAIYATGRRLTLGRLQPGGRRRSSEFNDSQTTLARFLKKRKRTASLPF